MATDPEKNPRDVKSSPVPGEKKKEASSEKPHQAEPARATYNTEQTQPATTSEAAKPREGEVVGATGPQVAVSQPYVIAVPAAFSDAPVTCTCNSCHQHVVSNLQYQTGTFTWLMCVVFCCLTACCCWIPFVFNVFKDVVHLCPNCGSVIGKYQRI
jgi:lipopolysaccharide-induced tumor necrosis factor-alpha factor